MLQFAEEKWLGNVYVGLAMQPALRALFSADRSDWQRFDGGEEAEGGAEAKRAGTAEAGRDVAGLRGRPHR